MALVWRGLTTVDFIKLALVLPLFGVVAPLLGVAMKGRATLQRVVFALMCFMTINGFLGPGNWGVTVVSIESYRGHTKGFHFYFNHGLAMALIVARWLEDPGSVRKLPPGLGLYLAYCAVSLLSVVNAAQTELTWMAAHKMIFAATLFLASYHMMRSDEDIQYFIKVMVITMVWQLLVVLKLKYVDGMYQVRGTFEHQNPLAMYAVLVGMLFLATGLGPGFRGANLALVGFVSCAVVVQSTLSRAALAAFGAGTMAVMVASVLERPTARRWLATAAVGMVGLVGLALTLDTIIARFHDEGNAASGELRQVMNEASREMAKDYTLGVGWNQYALVVNPPYRYTEFYWEWIRGRRMKVDPTRANAVVESHYYLLLGETGWPGLLMYLIMIGVGLWRNARAFWDFGHSFPRCVALGIGAGCLLNYGQSTLERVLVQPRNLMLWLILMGIAARLEERRREGRRAKAAGLAGNGGMTMSSIGGQS